MLLASISMGEETCGYLHSTPTSPHPWNQQIRYHKVWCQPQFLLCSPFTPGTAFSSPLLQCALVARKGRALSAAASFQRGYATGQSHPLQRGCQSAQQGMPGKVIQSVNKSSHKAAVLLCNYHAGAPRGFLDGREDAKYLECPLAPGPQTCSSISQWASEIPIWMFLQAPLPPLQCPASTGGRALWHCPAAHTS